MIAAVTRRINKELDKINRECPHISIRLVDDSLFHWRATITVPPGSVIAGEQFEVDINIPDAYPFKMPTITVISDLRIRHVNPISGAVCIIDEWAPSKTLVEILDFITTSLEHSAIRRSKVKIL